ncbi:TPA: acetyltransferase [Streptococcus suis]
MKKLAIIGASGHGKVVADIAEKNGYTDIVFLDDFSTGQCAGYPIIGTSSLISELTECSFIIAIGNAKIRERLQLQLEKKSVATLIHPAAVISRRVHIGEGTVVMAGAIINSDVSIGKGCIINTGSSIDHDCIVGNYVHVSVGAHVAGTVAIGSHTWIGAGATVVNNVTITNDTMIGAGAVVVKDCIESGTYIGIPARKRKI